MILKLDPQLPLVWRSPASVQLGIDPPRVVIDDVTEAQERILAALLVGVSAPGVTMIARGRLEERDELLELLAPALAATESPAPVATVAISGEEALVATLCETLAASGVRVVVAADAGELADAAPDLAILAAHYVLAPELHGFWLRRDVPHLPVVFSDTGAVVGPMIEPGAGPCLLCLELHRRDEDAAWPAIATQLLGRRSRAVSPALVLEAAATACRAALERLGVGDAPARAVRPAGAVAPDGTGAAASVRIDGATGERVRREWLPHPECGCCGIADLLDREPAIPGRRGTGWAAGARRAPAAPGPTRTARAGVEPA